MDDVQTERKVSLTLLNALKSEESKDQRYNTK